MKNNTSQIWVVYGVIILFLLVTISSRRAAKRVPEREPARETYIVQSGDTLWSICTSYRPAGMSIQEYIYNVEKANNISSEIYPGQAIDLLIYE